MSLQYDYSRCTDSDSFFDENDHMTPLTNAVIFGLMFIDLGEITEQNLDEVHDRFYVWQHAIAPMMANQDGPVYITHADLKRHVGLRCNISPTTKTKFAAKIMSNLRGSAESARKRELANVG